METDTREAGGIIREPATIAHILGMRGKSKILTTTIQTIHITMIYLLAFLRVEKIPMEL